MPDFERDELGPCRIKEGVYLKVKTNEYDEIQLHPCSGVLGLCPGVFIFIPNDGWVTCTDAMMKDRLNREIQIAVEQKVPGFHSGHRL